MMMNLKYLLVIGAILLSGSKSAVSQGKMKTEAEQAPRLVIAIVVDQMRFDYLYRYAERYTEGGFKRLLKDGFSCRNTNFNYVPTHTAPGHASIFTGATPSVHGIIGNDWYDRNSKAAMYCVSDSTVKPVGTTSISGKMSPRNLFSTTFCDELKMSNNFRSKVFGIGLKDRGAILPAGHSADAAYWHDPYLNNWVSSTYYLETLPQWVIDFNARKVNDSLLSFPWNTLFPVSTYTSSGPDDTPYEGLFKGLKKPVFPYDLPSLKEVESELIRKTPAGNTYTRLFAEALIVAENLGKGEVPDILTVSFSSPDYIGHMFGINSVEVEDTYLRLDRELENFLNFLDTYQGKENYLLFLTSDHGAAHNPEFLHDHKIPGEFIHEHGISDSIRAFLKNEFESKFLLDVSSSSVYLDREYIRKKGLNLSVVEQKCAEYISRLYGVVTAIPASDFKSDQSRQLHQEYFLNGYNTNRSGDVLIQYRPAWLSWYRKTGTSHGAPYSYDTHVPLIFFGKGIERGATSVPVVIPDIAPTISLLLNIEFPNATTGKPISPLLDR